MAAKVGLRVELQGDDIVENAGCDNEELAPYEAETAQ
jgi:hypothetical protein